MALVCDMGRCQKVKAEPFEAEDYKYDTKWTSWNQWPKEGGYSDEWNTWTKDEYDDPAQWESGNWDTSECKDEYDDTAAQQESGSWGTSTCSWIKQEDVVSMPATKKQKTWESNCLEDHIGLALDGAPPRSAVRQFFDRYTGLRSSKDDFYFSHKHMEEGVVATLIAPALGDRHFEGQNNLLQPSLCKIQKSFKSQDAYHRPWRHCGRLLIGTIPRSNSWQRRAYRQKRLQRKSFGIFMRIFATEVAGLRCGMETCEPHVPLRKIPNGSLRPAYLLAQKLVS